MENFNNQELISHTNLSGAKKELTSEQSEVNS